MVFYRGGLIPQIHRELRFLLPVREMMNWESENDSFLIPLIPIPGPNPPKYAKIGQGFGITIL